MTRVFLTGASGFVGGDVLHAISSVQSTYQIACLVRSDVAANKIRARYPNVTLVTGDLNDTSLLEEQAAQADVILNLATSNHIESVKAMVRGMEEKATGGVIIQISGASIFAYAEIKAGSYGEASDQVLDDVADIALIKKLAEAHPSRLVDKFFLSLPAASKTKWAIVCPPCIHGTARGPANQRSIQIPDLAKATLQAGHGLCPGKGLSRWSMVHIQDLTAIFVKLAQSASEIVAGNESAWKDGGYYFGATEEKSWGEVAELTAKAAHDQGLIQSAHVVSVTKEEADAITPHGSVLYGVNARTEATRARNRLGWAPVHASCETAISQAVEQEASKLKS